MKNGLLVLLAAFSVLVGCAKSQKAGSTLTKQLSGTRSYDHIYSTNYPFDSVAHDTLTLTIQYVDDATIKIHSLPLTYVPSLSSDDIPYYQYSVPSMAVTYTLQFNSGTNTIVYNAVGGTTAVHFSETYTSF